MSVGQMSTMGEIHTEDRISWLTEGEVGGDVGWCTRVCLDIRIFTVEQFTSTLYTELFERIREGLTTIVALMRISFRVFVRKY